MCFSRITRFVITVFLLSPVIFIAPVTAQLPTTPPSHIVILIEENYAYSQIIGGSAVAYAPYINALCASPFAAVFTQSYALSHPSEPNYLDFFSGANQGVTNDAVPSGYPFTTPNLASQLRGASKTFITYSEDLPAPGYDGATYTGSGSNYARKHNPCANWMGTGVNQYPGNVVNMPYTGYFPDSGNYGTLPTVCYVIPNMTNDMHDGSYPSNITIGDTWYHNHLNSLLPWALDNNTLFVIIFDEDDDLHSNNVPTIFYGPMVQGGTYSQKVNFCNILRTFEDMYGLGHAGCAADSSAITFCWRAHPVDVNNINTISSFEVIPNPANNVINFKCDDAQNTQLNIVVTDELGRISGKYTMNGTQMQVNTASYVPGIYFYRVLNESNNKIVQGKFVINHN